MNSKAVLGIVHDMEQLHAYAAKPDPLAHIGFTGFIGRQQLIESDSEARAKLTHAGFTMISMQELGGTVDLSTEGTSAAELWTQLDAGPQYVRGSALSGRHDGSGSRAEAWTLLQMALPPIPLVPISMELVYSAALREQRELLRSLVFWRKRLNIGRQAPKLVHAGDDGLLIFITDSWLITVNQNPEEASIDLGSHGSMWLMLGTRNDVHLHGSMLILPPHSGAVVANELAR